MAYNNLIKFRKGTQTQWSDTNPILASGEPGFETDTNRIKIGDGVNWNDTRYITSESLITTVFNNTGSIIPKFTVVYINGGQGDQPTIQKAIANSEATSSKTYGITAQDIGVNSLGSVIVEGALTNLNTDQFNPSAPTGNVNGTALWLSPTVSGGFTTSKPYAPNHMVFVGTIIRTHQNEGIVEVKIQNGYELEELHNVATTGATNGQFLQYNSGSGLWIPSSSGNFTSLSVNNTGVIVSSGGTANYVSKFTGNNTISNSIIFDNGTNVGIGTTTPSGKLHVIGSGIFSNSITASGFIKSGGTSSQFLKANGSIDSTTYQEQISDLNNFYVGDMGGSYISSDTVLYNVLVSIDSAISDINIDSTIVRTNGNQSINGVKTFYNVPIFNSGIQTSGNISISTQTANTIASFDSNKNITSLSTGTYPSLMELSYVKGSTSNIQTQLNNKQNALNNLVTGTGSTNYIAKWGSSSGLINSTIYDNDGYIGIGTTSPDQNLSVVGLENVFSVVGDDLTYGGQSPATILKGYTWFGKADGSVGIGAHHGDLGTFNSAADFYLFEGFNENVTVYTPICFAAGYDPQLYLDTSLNVGIGTSTPVYKLDVNGSIGDSSNGTLDLNGFRITNSNPNIGVDAGAGDLAIGTDGSVDISSLVSNQINLNGNITIDGNIHTLKSYSENVSNVSISSNTLTLDLNTSNLFTCLLNSSITTFTISNIPAISGVSIGFTLILTADGTARTIAWPGTVKWAGGIPPTLTSTNNKMDVFSFVSVNNGTSWLGFIGGQNY